MIVFDDRGSRIVGVDAHPPTRVFMSEPMVLKHRQRMMSRLARGRGSAWMGRRSSESRDFPVIGIVGFATLKRFSQRRNEVIPDARSRIENRSPGSE